MPQPNGAGASPCKGRVGCANATHPAGPRRPVPNRDGTVALKNFPLTRK